MITLPLFKEVKYWSPTGFIAATECEFSHYLRRLSNHLLPQEPQSPPMAVGSAFDSFVKAELARRLGKPEYKNKLSKLLETVSNENDQYIKAGHDLFNIYVANGCLENLINDGLEEIELSIEKSIGGEIVPGTETMFGSIPLFGKPDASLRGLIPHDWKVNGYGSNSGQSPKQGYKRCISNGVDKGPHKKVGMTLEEIDYKWGVQLVFYNWMLGNHYTDNLYGSIDQIACRGDTVAIASFRVKIGEGFARTILDQLTDMHNRFIKGEFKEPEPSFNRCEPYGNARVCTLVCDSYKKTLGDSDYRKVMKA